MGDKEEEYRWKFSAEQPRVPAGSPEGGQWTSTGLGWTQVGGRGSLKDVQIGNEKYQVDTAPTSGDPPIKLSFARILKIIEHPEGGPLAAALGEITRRPMMRQNYTEVGEDELRSVVRSLGWNYSKSNVWRDTWEYYVGREERRRRRNG